jgi:crotonobetainyl-CoA:carnitine CoA-transferase CaiB-like acyl-CoA transferase
VRLPAPLLGEHTDTVFAALGYALADLAALHASGIV